MSTAHDKYVALQRHRNAAPLALDPRTTALVIMDMYLHDDLRRLLSPRESRIPVWGPDYGAGTRSPLG